MNAREVALAVVRDVFAPPDSRMPERSAQEALDYRLRKAELDARDRGFATELAYGAIKMRRTLDWYLEPSIGDRREPMPPAIREILRLAIYELAYTEADAHATVFEFVNLAKKYGHRGLANLVNAVLRRFLREPRNEPIRDRFDSDVAYDGVRYSLPDWILRQWVATFGAAQVEAIAAGVNAPAQAAVAVNLARATRDEVAERFAAGGIETRASALAPDALLFAAASARLPRADGRWWTQSESSCLPVAVLNPQPGERVLDLCSGRGNKALQTAARLNGDGELICVERDARKAEVLRARLEQAGFAAGIVVGDAADEALQVGRPFDRVLLDAPCSGLGVLGRHPEARWKKHPADGERLASAARTLLERAARHVHPGGVLVYAVCSTDPRETTEVIEWFLNGHNFERGLISAALEPVLSEAGDVLVPPGIAGRDGFYVARLERRG